MHKFRTLRGTTIFRQEMQKLFDKRPSMDNMSETLAAFKEIATKVGTALNHVRRGTDGSSKITFNTAVNSYIDEAAMLEFFEHYEMPLPAFLSKKVVTSAVEEEDFEDDSGALEIDAGLIEEYLTGERDYLD